MSSIIKGGRIRNQTVINLSERLQITQVEYERSEPLDDEAVLGEQGPEAISLMHLEAQNLLDEAQQKAEIIINNALKEAEEIRKEAAFEKTNLLEDASNKHQLFLEQAREEAAQIVKNAYQEKEQIINSTEPELAQTLIALLQYLVGEEVYHNTGWVRCIIKRMLANDVFKKDIKVYVSPEVYNRLTDSEKESLMSIKEEVTLQVSEALSNTACKVETQEGAIEYDVVDGLDQVISDLKILQNLKQENL
ncbi:FliH/SctL family protein [Cellulosilyticum sp. I15G10I2]|uniref:FliH/SctL family protein n=1 Tax=Cellulosilyticum sp. I15G10I2 TaxID=1892843 RepID=UPI00085C0462|nr:FliH/SctL family protein [Cellulosilyticum sp. I15G10I2]